MEESALTLSDVILYFVLTTEAAVSSQFLRTGELMRRFKELKSGIIRRAASLFMMIRTTNERRRKNDVFYGCD